MESKKQTHETKRQRRLLLVLPLLALPFLTVLFWAMGGGKGDIVSTTEAKKGFNIKLPDAKINEENPPNKLNYYDMAALDSLKFEELKKKDPNYANSETLLGYPADSLGNQRPRGKRSRLIMSSYRDPNEEKVYDKLEALQRAINTPAPTVLSERTAANQNSRTKDNSDMRALEQMIQSVSDPEQEDKELEQIGGLLENILDIQHPDRMQEKLRKASQAERGQVFAVSPSTEESNITLLQEPRDGTGYFGTNGKHNGFYSLENTKSTPGTQNAIQAVIAETQTLTNGSTVKMRLDQEIYISGTKIPRDTFVFGTASLKGERLTIAISGIRYGNSLFPVDLTVYDLDGLDGIFIPGAINRDVAKASAERSMQSLGVTTLDESWGAQAAGAGLEAAKSLFSKKVKLVKVVVKAGYQLLLHDKKQKDKS